MMPAPNPISTIVPPKIPTGQEIFDAIMGHIEPELTTEELKKLEATYKDETPEQMQARKQRYELAFERYEQAYEGYMATLHTQVSRYRRASFAQVELEETQRDNGIMEQMSKSFFSSFA